MRVLTTPNTTTPEVHLLSNGQYHVMITNAGTGYSRWRDLAVTRSREDVAQDDTGTFCDLRDVTSNDVWSVAHQPTLKPSTAYRAIFPQSRAEFRRRDFDVDTYTEVAVSPEDDVELRRINISNHSRIPRTIELTSYAEVVLATPPRTRRIRPLVISSCKRNLSAIETRSFAPPSPLSSGESSLDAPFNVGAWSIGRHNVIRNRSREIPGPGPHGCRPASHGPPHPSFE